MEIIEGIATVPVDGVLGRHPTRFRGRMETILEPGFLAAFKDRKPDERLPEIADNVVHPVGEVWVHGTVTKPPKPFTEDTLLGAMLNAAQLVEGADRKLLNHAEGIGTPATRDTVIEVLIDRAYIERRKTNDGDTLRITERGQALIENTPDSLADIHRTVELEYELQAMTEETSDERARQRRDAFIDTQANTLTTHIEEVNEAMANAPETPTDNTPAEKMINAAEKIAEARYIDLPEGCKTNFDTCRAFLDEQMEHPAPPTPRMIDYAKRIHNDTKAPLGDALETFDACKKYIDDNAERASSKRAPTEKMVGAARAIAKRKGIDVPSNVVESFDACKAFLDQHPKGS